jgi:peptidoglycan-associated lipoprotein
MQLKFLALVAVGMLVASCGSTPDETASTSGAGAAGDASARSAGPSLGTQNDLAVNVGDRVHFDFDKYNIKSDGRKVLAKQASWLKKFPGTKILVAGNCDERGTREYNLALGERRANAAKDYLVALGISPNRIKTISYGKERPVAMGSNDAAWAQNRNAITSVIGG